MQLVPTVFALNDEVEGDEARFGGRSEYSRITTPVDEGAADAAVVQGRTAAIHPSLKARNSASGHLLEGHRELAMRATCHVARYFHVVGARQLGISRESSPPPSTAGRFHHGSRSRLPRATRCAPGWNASPGWAAVRRALRLWALLEPLAVGDDQVVSPGSESDNLDRRRPGSAPRTRS